MIKFILILITLFWSTVALSDPATIIAISSAVASSFVVAKGYTTLVTIIALTSIAVVSAYLQQQVAKKNAVQEMTGRMVSSRQPTASRRIIYGEVRIGGTIVFVETTGTTNEFVHVVIALAGHEVNAIGQIYFDDHAISLEADGTASSSDKYSGFARVEKKLGTANQTAFSTLVSEVTDWTANHRLRNIACIYIRLKNSNDKFPNGIPNITAIVQGKKVYDPRSGSTAYSDNSALCIADYLTDATYGLGCTYANEIDNAQLIVASNVCDETVTLNSNLAPNISSEKRYTCNGSFDSDEEPEKILQDMTTSMGGSAFFTSGRWFIEPARYKASIGTLRESEVLKGFAVKTKQSRRSQYNTIKGIFSDPNNLYQPTDFPSVTNSTYITQDNGEVKTKDVAFPFTTSSTTAQRLAKLDLQRSRDQREMVIQVSLLGLHYRVGDTVSFNAPNLGWDETASPSTKPLFEIVNLKINPNKATELITVELHLKEITQSLYAWSSGSDQQAQPTGATTNLIDPLTVAQPSNLVLTELTNKTKDGSIVPQVRAEWDEPSDFFSRDSYAVGIRQTSASASTLVEYTTDNNYYIFENVPFNILMTVSVQAINSLGVKSNAITGQITITGATSFSGTITNPTATGGKQKIILSWTNPTDPDFSKVEIRRNTTNNLATATLIASISGTVFVDDELPSNVTRFYFLRAIDRSGNAGASTSVLQATTLPNLADQIADAIVTTSKFASGIRTIEVLSSLPTSGNSQGDVVFLTSDNQLYRFTGSAFTKVIQGGDVNFDDVPDGTIHGEKMVANTIHGDRIHAGSVNASRLQANTITAGQIQAGAIGVNELASSSITADKIATNVISANKMDVVTLSSIQSNLGNISSGGQLTVAGGSGGIQLGSFSGSIPTINIPSGGARAMLPTIYRGLLTAGTTADNSNSTIGESIRADSTGTSGIRHGIRARNTSRGSSGLVGVDSGFNVDFFGEGFGKIYVANGVVPFTGVHLVFMEKTEIPDVGDIVVDERMILKQNVSNTFTLATSSHTQSQKTCLGVYIGNRIVGSLSEHLTKFLEEQPMNVVLEISRYDMVEVNSVGEGQINVCGRNGDIEAGDLIVTSTMTGKGQKQDDDIVRNSTVAKARESYSFSSVDETKMIGCIYLCG